MKSWRGDSRRPGFALRLTQSNVLTAWRRHLFFVQSKLHCSHCADVSIQLLFQLLGSRAIVRCQALSCPPSWRDVLFTS